MTGHPERRDYFQVAMCNNGEVAEVGDPKLSFIEASQQIECYREFDSDVGIDNTYVVLFKRMIDVATN
jgi:hypothetical protein